MQQLKTAKVYLLGVVREWLGLSAQGNSTEPSLIHRIWWHQERHLAKTVPVLQNKSHFPFLRLLEQIFFTSQMMPFSERKRKRGERDGGGREGGRREKGRERETETDRDR